MSSLSNHDRELQNYFTDVEYLREMTDNPMFGIPLILLDLSQRAGYNACGGVRCIKR